MKKIRWLRRDRASTAVLMILVSACSRDVQQITEAPRTSVFTQQGDPEREALTRVARGIALALGESEFRKGVMGSMQKALFKEHKLELKKFLTGSNLKTVAAASGRTSDAILADLTLIRPLEFYMPIEAQRAAWTGGGELLVVTGIEEDQPITGFDLRGNEVAMSSTEAPSLPTLAIVPQETDFDKPVDSKKSINVDDQNGGTIGTLVPCDDPTYPCRTIARTSSKKLSPLVACVDDCGGGGGGYVTPGFYMTFSRIVDAKEPWWKGSPEVEVHVHAPLSAANSQYGADLSCSGEHALAERYFNQDNNFWNGSVLIVDKALDELITSQRSDGYHIIFWEDDSTPCQMKINQEWVRQLLVSTVAAVGTAALKGAKWPAWGLIPAAFFANLLSSNDWLWGNDDMIGTLVPTRMYYQDGSNFQIMDGATLNGRALIQQK
ncbi:MAG TPA: hypothetical protein VM099_07875 [Gemmatimonadaceae bacterium]|nr:hypothetical protein [Gemmatimonadaceae bacterium]